MSTPTTSKPHHDRHADQRALEDLLSRYWVLHRGRALCLRLRKSVKLESDGKGGQLLHLADFNDAIWDAPESEKERGF